jgi:hypothetical protein
MLAWRICVRVLLVACAALGGCGGGGGGSPPPGLFDSEPKVVTQGAVDVLLTVTGENFRPGARVGVGGSGVTVSSVTVDSDTRISARLSLAPDAPFGLRDILYFASAQSVEPATRLLGALRVDAPMPEVDDILPGVVTQGDRQVALLVSGRHFRSGGEIDLGPGITVTDLVVVSDSEIEVSADVASHAAMGPRGITYAQPIAGGGAEGTLPGALLVHAPAPAVMAASPAVLKQGESGVPVSLTGTGFRAGGTIRLGAGLQVTGVTVASDSSASATVSVAIDAAPGPREVVFQQPAVGGAKSGALADGITVHYPDPAVTSVEAASLKQEDEDVTLTVKGENFRDGGTIAISGAGLTVGATTVVSETEATVVVSVSSDAAVGKRDIEYTQSQIGGGAAGKATELLTILYPDPEVASIQPGSITQGTSGVTLTLAGKSFREGGTVSAGDGIGLSDPTYLSDTSFEVTIEADAFAELGLHDVAYQQPTDGGGAAATLADALQVNAPAPKVTSISPSALKQGDTGATLTVKGEDFREGGSLALGGSGLTVGATTVVSATEATVEVDVAANAAITSRDVVFTQPQVGGGASATGSGLLAIHYPDPQLASVDPPSVPQGTVILLTITGTGFRPDAVIETSSDDVTLTSAEYVSATEYTVVAEADADAVLGPRDLTYTHDPDGGGSAHTLDDAFQVVPLLFPNRLLAGDGHVLVSVTGQGFDSGMKVGVSGSGVTVHSTSHVSGERLIADISVASNAAFGARDVTLTPGDGSSASTYDDVLRIVPAPPSVTGCAPITVCLGATDVSMAVEGMNFRSGDTLSVSGGDITVESTTVNGSGSITAVVSIADDADLGSRDVTVTHSEDDGGTKGTLKGAFAVVAADPEIGAVSPAKVGRTGSGGVTRIVPITVSGSGFASGATLSVSHSSGSGVEVVSGSEQVISDKILKARIAVEGEATTDSWDLLVTNPGSAGDSGSSGDGLLEITDEDTLTVNNVAPEAGSAHGGERVTVYGAGFSSQAVVDFGSVRAAGTLVVDQNTITTTVPVPTTVSDAGSTAVDVTVTNPSGAAAKLKSGYVYGEDTVPLKVVATFPAQGATGVPKNLVSAAVLLSSPLDTGTASFGSTTGTHCMWFETGGSLVSSGKVAFGPQARWLVLTRTGGGNLAISNQGIYTLDLPTALKSIGGVPLTPTRLAELGDHDQRTFTISSSATDTTSPTATIAPGDKATDQDTTVVVTITFSEPVDPQTVTAANVSLSQGSTTVPAALGLGSDLKTITLTPLAQLSTSTTYTTAVGSGVTDLCGNAFSSTSYTFATNDGTDATAPTIEGILIEDLPGDVDGSGTYVNATGSGGNAFDLYLPRGGWLVRVSFSDHGGAGIDETTFSAVANVDVGSDEADAELAPYFAVTPTEAWWIVPDEGFATGNNATLTVKIGDRDGNESDEAVITFDVFDLAANATLGNDHHPFDTRNAWVLRADLDVYAATYHTTTSPAQQGVTTTVSSNGVLDLDEALRLVGLNTANMTSAAAATTRGDLLGTNNIVRRIFLERTRALLNERFGIDQDGARGSDSVNIEFLLPGESGSLASMPVYSTSNTSNSSKAFSEISIGGTQGAQSSAYSGASVLASAYGDARNARQEANLNLGSGTITGVYLTNMLKLQVVTSGTNYFDSKVSAKLVTIHGGTPVGEDGSDDDVLAGSFDRASSSNSTLNARYDTIMDAIELVALYTSAVTAHEVGHSVGLVMDGAPPTGLFGKAHYSNTFTEATSAAPNTSWHLNFLGNDLMAASTSFDQAAQSGADFKRFDPLCRCYMLARLGYDEGK